MLRTVRGTKSRPLERLEADPGHSLTEYHATPSLDLWQWGGEKISTSDRSLGDRAGGFPAALWGDYRRR